MDGVSGNAVNRFKILTMVIRDSPIESDRNTHSKKLPTIWAIQYISFLSPSRNADVSHTRPKKGLRQRSIKVRPTTKAFLEKPRRRNKYPAPTEPTSRIYGKLEEISCCQLSVVPSVVIHARANSPSQNLGINFT